MKPALWQISFAIGITVIFAIMGIESLGLIVPEAPLRIIELIAGVLVIAGSSEAFVQSVEGISTHKNLTEYVSGIYASLASTIPELSVLTFLLLAGNFEMAWVLALSTIFVNSLVFAIYTLVLPKDEHGNYTLPDAIMWVGSDLLSMGAVISLAVGFTMLMLFVFAMANPLLPKSLDAGELLMFGSCLVAVFIVYLYRITKYYGKLEPQSDEEALSSTLPVHDMTPKKVAIFMIVAAIGALIGGEALAGFAEWATEVQHLNFIHAALLLVLFGGAPEYIIVASSHKKEKIEVALSNAFGGIVQVFFIIFGYTLLAGGIIALIFNVTNVIPIDLFSVVLLFFAFPTLFILRVTITDDSKVNMLESATMIAVFIMMLYILLVWGAFPISTP
ncbi:MAG: hypothetical protein K9W43_10970 [Candidatus Thorarchaeota archaeon]|nr:hypothetical protein [Candidatus Thorarchaeota archaeon]